MGSEILRRMAGLAVMHLMLLMIGFCNQKGIHTPYHKIPHFFYIHIGQCRI